MLRQLVVWILVSFLAVVSGDVVRAAGPGGAIPERLDARTLYLRAGTFDTRALPNVLDEPHARNVTATRSFDQKTLYVIQLAGPILPEKRTALEQAGVALGDYLPQNAYVADLSGASRAALAQLGFVRFVGEYNRAWKIAPDIGQRVFVTEERQALQDGGRHALAVSIFKHASLEQVADAMDLIETAVVHFSESTQRQSTVSVSIDTEHVEELAALPGVQFIEEAPEITLRNATVRWIVQSNILDFTPLHDHGLHGEEQIVGILDNKIDVDHCSFFDTEPIGPTHRKILAYNTTLGISSHGTHVAGIVVGDEGTFNNLRGHAYLGKLVYNTIPSYNETGIVTALNLHHSQGAHVHTNSWGNDGTTEYDSLARGFDVFCYENEDDLVALAVTNTLTLRNPENAKNLLAVGATADTPSQHTHCYGGTGPTSDGRRKPEIYAPGCVIQSARYNTECDAFSRSGTSMACPAVAGAGMLVRQYFMQGYYPSGQPDPEDGFTPSGALIKSTLLNSAVDLTGETGYPTDKEGWGRVLADDALYFPGDDRKLAVLEDVRNVDGLSTEEAIAYDLTVDGSAEKLKVTLVWTDAPAAAGTSFAAVNDLDLEVEAPGGELYLGNVFSGGVSVTGGAKDDRNNVEQVHIESPEAGLWQVRVVAAAVNEGTQGYALVATGGVHGGLPFGDGDFDEDGDVDLEDFAAFAECFGSAGVDGCMPGRMVEGDTIDLDDFGAFQAAMTGPLGS